MNYEKILDEAFEIAREKESFNKYVYLMKKKNVCVWGLGTYFKEAFVQKKIKERYHVNILCDNASEKWGTEIEGLEVVSPEKLLTYEDLIVIIMVGNPTGIQKQLTDKGVEWITHVDLSIDEELGFTREVNEVISRKEEIINTLNLLEDDLSKKTYAFGLANRFSTKLRCDWGGLETGGEYFGQDFMPLTDKEIFVDCGAYNGDTVQRFIESVDSYEKIFAFELDKTNYNELISNTSMYENVTCINKGVFNEEKTISYSLGDGDNEPMDGISIYKENCSTQLTGELCSLDNELDGEKITFIKMDIEGSEIGALLGARRIIEEQKPKLAICLYHKSSDFWEIPELIKQINPSYKMYVRHHFRYNCWGTVLYAV